MTKFLEEIRRLDVCIIFFTAVLLSVVIGMSLDFPLFYRAALYSGLLGIAIFSTLSNKRILLVIAWILLHPLSLEKVFIVGKPLLPEFFPPRVVFSASDIVFIILLLYLFFESFLAKDEKVWVISSPIVAFSFFTLWVIINFIVHRFSTATALAVLHTVKMLLFVVVFASAIRTRDELLVVLLAVSLALGIQVILVLISHFLSVAFHISPKISGQLMTFPGMPGHKYVRATGTVGHVNQEACFLTFFSFPLIGMLGLKNKWWRISAAVILVCTFIVIILTFSRSAWISYVVGCAVVLFLVWKENVTENDMSLYLFPVVAMTCIFLMVFHQPILDRLLHGDVGATESRKRAIVLSLDLFKFHPVIGVGIGNFVGASLEKYPPQKIKNIWMKPGQQPRPLAYRYGRLEVNTVKIGNKLYVIPLPVHNKYLLVLTELGMIGFFFFLWFLLSLFKMTLRSLRTTDKFLLLTAIGAAAGFWANVCYMSFDLFADDKTVEILLFVPVLILSLSRIVKTTTREVSVQ